MQVLIDGRQCNYVSDYSPANIRWKIQAGAAFAFPVKISTKTCFVKRFASPPPGLGLLLILKHIKVPGPLPTVYDVVEVNENGQAITYLFLELIEGNTLDDIITQRQSFHSRKLTNDLLDCLALIHDNGFWFSDFCEKNIFYDGAAQRYTLIDLDSCEEIKYHPSSIPNTSGYVPGQEFAAAVVNFYKQVLKIPNFTFSTLSGKQLNLLQLIPLVAKLELFVKAVKAQPTFTYKASNFPKLQGYIAGKKFDYSKAVFHKVIQNQATAEMITTLCGFFTSTYGPDFDPKIISFKVKPTLVEIGDIVTFSWETSNVDYVEIKSSDGTFVQKNLPTGGICTYRVSKGQRFRLVADTVSQILDIRIIPPAKIKSFNAPHTQIYFGEKVALSWEIEGRPKLIILTEYDQSGKVIWSDTNISMKGAKAVTPASSDQTYVLNIGTAKQEIQIKAVQKPKIEYFLALPSEIKLNEQAKLSWLVHNTSSVTLYSQSVSKQRVLLGVFDASKEFLLVDLTETTTYFLHASGISQEVTISVKKPYVSYFKISEQDISIGQDITLSWRVNNTDKGSIIIIDKLGSEQLLLADLYGDGSLKVFPTEDTTYKLDVGSEVKVAGVKVRKSPIVNLWFTQRWRKLLVGLILTALLGLIFLFRDKIFKSIENVNVAVLPSLTATQVPSGKDDNSIQDSDVKRGVDSEDTATHVPLNPPQTAIASDSPPKSVEPPSNPTKAPEIKIVIPPSAPVKPLVNKKPESIQSKEESLNPQESPPIIIPEPAPQKSPPLDEKPAGEGMKWRREDGLWALYDSNKNRKTSAKYKSVTSFNNGKAKVYELSNPSALIIDKEGNILPN